MIKLIALICKKDEISESEFRSYYENKHVPLIKSIFPSLVRYERKYLNEANILHGEFTLESINHNNIFNVITELTFEDEKGLNQFFEIAAKEEIVEIIRKDEENFLDSRKTIMYRID
tara:strand:- start:1543 stop:1893 length:351 start_codon:yes stop_codon:yes gene_type:complete